MYRMLGPVMRACSVLAVVCAVLGLIAAPVGVAKADEPVGLPIPLFCLTCDTPCTNFVNAGSACQGPSALGCRANACFCDGVDDLCR